MVFGESYTSLTYWCGSRLKVSCDARRGVETPVLGSEAELGQLVELLALLNLVGVSGHGGRWLGLRVRRD